MDDDEEELEQIDEGPDYEPEDWEADYRSNYAADRATNDYERWLFRNG
jgi:hypothetical protein